MGGILCEIIEEAWEVFCEAKSCFIIYQVFKVTAK